MACHVQIAITMGSHNVAKEHCRGGLSGPSDHSEEDWVNLEMIRIRMSHSATELSYLEYGIGKLTI